jgi:hypothetical protein
MLHQEEMISINHMSRPKNLIYWIWKTRKEINLVHIVKKFFLLQKVPSLPWLVLTCCLDIETNDILKLNQWNHADAMDVEEIMHQTRLHVIKLDKPRSLKKNSHVTSTWMHKTMNTKKKNEGSFEIHILKFESYLFMCIIVVKRCMKPPFVSSMMEFTAMCQERSCGWTLEIWGI